MSRIEVIAVAEAHARMKAQSVSSREHIAFKCPICGTIQSIASLVKAGVPADRAEKYVGFSCEGRFSGAGPWTKAPRRQLVRGCDWTLGGLLHLHKLEVEHEDNRQMTFEIATPEEAQALEAVTKKERA
jgi:hypothetical protein